MRRVVAGLPFHHRDPFDRLLAAQALAEGIALVARCACVRCLRCGAVASALRIPTLPPRTSSTSPGHPEDLDPLLCLARLRRFPWDLAEPTPPPPKPTGRR